MTKMVRSFIVAAAVMATPLAYAVPFAATRPVRFQTVTRSVHGTMVNGNIESRFDAYVWDDGSGMQGAVDVVHWDFAAGTVAIIRCAGPAFANAVSVNQGNGTSRLEATLDPASSDCWRSDLAPMTVMTITAIGTPNGDWSSHDTGTGRFTEQGMTYRYTSQWDQYGTTFTGTNGFQTGVFEGVAAVDRRSDLIPM